MTIEKLQKYLDEHNITLEEYLRNNMVSEEEKKYWDNMWIDAIYRNFKDD